MPVELQELLAQLPAWQLEGLQQVNWEQLQTYLTNLGVWLQLILVFGAIVVGLVARPWLAKLDLAKSERINTIIHAANFTLPTLLALWLGQMILHLMGEPTMLLSVAVTANIMLWLWVIAGRFGLDARMQNLLRLGVVVILFLLLSNQLESIVGALQAARFELGNFSISLWHVIKAAALFGAVVWAVNELNKLLIRALSGTRLSSSGQTLMSKFSNAIGFVIAGLIALQALGIDISALAVFGGAIGLGLGFGLRSIVSNYISGIILLLDRSLKPGDVIEVEGTYGYIAEMNARFVVVRPRNNADILIPNEMLLTNQVVNWSYKNRAVRQALEIGVSYDTDMEKVTALMIDAIKDHERVLKKPGPRCFITEFGDSSVNFELRFWMRDPENGVKVLKGELYLLVWNALKDNNIEIPFPQRVIHMPSRDNK